MIMRARQSRQNTIKLAQAHGNPRLTAQWMAHYDGRFHPCVFPRSRLINKVRYHDDDDDSEDGGASWRYLERNYLKMILNSTTAKSARYTIEFAGREFKWNSLAAWNA